MTVAQLKSWMHSKGMHASGKKKGELVDIVQEYFEKT